MAEDKNKTSSLIGKTFGGYRIRKLLGKGGMGEVYEGYEQSLDRKVAVKVLRSVLAADDEFTARFLREARAAAKLEHPGICPVYAAGEDNGIFYFAMQYVSGRTVRQYLKEYGSFPVQQALLVVQHTAAALGYAHSKGFIHRDIKPDNIMVDEDGRIKVMDFGLARSEGKSDAITQTGDYLGTPEYSSPEQCMTSSIDRRSDLYSLGAVMYEMLTGNTPHNAETPLALFKKICEDPLPPLRELNPGVPEKAVLIAERLLEKNPEDRYSSAEELCSDIERVLAQMDETLDPSAETMALPLKKLSASTPPNLKPTPVTGTGRKNTYAMVFAVSSLLLALIISAVIFVKYGKPEGPVPVPDKAVLLVCDFANSNNNPDIEWMSIAVADMSITDLSQCGFLQVISREQLGSFLEKEGLDRTRMMESLIPVSQKLSADMILKGSVAKLGNEIRIDIQLLDGTDGSLILAADETEPEETFFNAIDELSVKLRSRIGEYLAGKYPEMKTAGAENDLSLDTQLFSAALPAGNPAADRPEISRKRDPDTEGSPVEAQIRKPEAVRSHAKRESIGAAAEEKGAARDGERKRGVGTKALLDDTETELGDGAVIKKSAGSPDGVPPAPERALKSDKALGLQQFGKSRRESSPKFAAVRAYYRACSLIEENGPNARRLALQSLDYALNIEPSLKPARELKQKLINSEN